MFIFNYKQKSLFVKACAIIFPKKSFAFPERVRQRGRLKGDAVSSFLIHKLQCSFPFSHAGISEKLFSRLSYAESIGDRLPVRQKMKKK